MISTVKATMQKMIGAFADDLIAAARPCQSGVRPDGLGLVENEC